MWTWPSLWRKPRAAACPTLRTQPTRWAGPTYQKGVYRSAIDMFQESLRLNEKNGGADDPTVHYHLGLAYQKANQPVQARQQLERALKISPNNSDAKKALSELRG